MEFIITSKKWNDRKCTDHRPYICEINGKYNILHEHIYMQTIDGLKLVLKGHSRPMHMRIRYHFLADLHVTRHA